MKILSKISILFCLLFIFNSCSTPRPEGKTEAEVLYKEASRLIDKGRYLLAIEKLNTIRSKYPYSYYAKHAELLNADILYKQENFAEAAAAYIVFKDFHPKYEKMNYVLFKIAESFYNQMPDTFDRDLSPGFEAIRYYKDLLKRPDAGDFAKNAKEKIDYCEKMIMNKEKYIADFYYKTEVYDAAKYRYLIILKEFSDTEIRNHSMLKILESVYNLKEKSECVKYYRDFSRRIGSDKKEELKNTYNKCVELKGESA